jgi:hypothetical protein
MLDIVASVLQSYYAGKSVGDWIDIWDNRYKYYIMFYKSFYYFSRIITCLCAAILPFIIGKVELVNWSTSFSIIIAVLIAHDFVLNSKDNWKKYAKAQRRLQMNQLHTENLTQKELEALKIIDETENGVDNTISIEELLNKIKGLNKV